MYRGLSFFIIVIGAITIDYYQELKTGSGCKVLYGTTLICKGTLDFTTTPRNRNITSVEFYHLNETIFPLGAILKHFPKLRTLVINRSELKNVELVGHIEKEELLEVIAINDVTINEIDEAIFDRFRNLHVLDLRNNSLRLMHSNQTEHLRHIKKIYLSGNKWNCSENLDWAYRFNSTQIVDLLNLTCYDEPFPGKPLRFVSEILHRTAESCPSGCDCSLFNVYRNRDLGKLQPVVQVDCSDSDLIVLPESLPEDTAILKVGGNRIDDLTPLIKNRMYRDVTDLYADGNRVESVDLLEGSYWLRNFRVLSLKGNRLTDLPTYAMDSALEQNPNMPNAVMLFLGDNPWRCDCIFTPGFQEDILVKYEPQIQDMPDVKCARIEGDENSGLSIVSLSRSSICESPNEYTVLSLNILNGVLASLIVLILGKLAYDYYYFKRTGKLPWIVTKMP